MGLRYLLLLMLGLLCVGIMLNDAALVAMSGLPFALFWLSMLLPAAKARITVQLPYERLFVGSDVPLTVSVQPTAALHLVQVPGHAAVISTSATSFVAQQQHNFSITQRWQSCQTQLPARQSMSSNALGWLWNSYRHNEPYAIAVEPEHHSAPRIALYSRQTRGFAGPILSKNVGTGIELAGIGEYQAGKSLRHINWRASAKQHEKLLINEFVLEQMTNISVLIDARSKVNSSEYEPLFDYTKSAALALAHSFDRDGHQLDFFVFGKSWQQQKGGGGASMLTRLQQLLAATDVGCSPHWGELANNINKLIPIGHMIVVISPLAAQDMPLYHTIRALGYPCLVISPNQQSLLRKWAEPSVAAETVFALQTAQRALTLAPFKALNIPVLDWHLEQPFSQALLQFQPELRLWHRQLKQR